MTVSASPASARTSVDRSDRWLLGSAALFAVAVVLHNSDHLRRGADAVDVDVFWLGTLGIVIEVVIVGLIAQRHRLAPLASAVAGASLAAGYVVVHFLPERSWFSDSFVSAEGVSPLSWAAASVEVVAALILTAAGVAALSARGGLASAARPHPAQRSVADAIRHPLALLFGLSQVAVIAVSFAQI